MSARSTSRQFHSLPFVWLSLAAAVLPGFGAGATLFALLLTRQGAGAAWAAAAQAHGHAQVFGFAGGMVFGVGLYFLPRLRGAPLASPERVPVVLALYAGGLLLRMLGQQVGPLLAEITESPAIAGAFAVALALSGPLELAGAALAVSILVRTGLPGPPLAGRAGISQVLPLMVGAWAGLLLALALTAAGTVVAGYRAVQALALPPDPGSPFPWLLPPGIDAAAVRLALLGWLVPLAVAFAARNFPLFLRTPLASPRSLRWGLAILVDALIADTIARFTPGGWDAAQATGAFLLGAALLWFTYAVGALGPKVVLPGRHHAAAEVALERATGSPLAGAFAWLAAAGVLLLIDAGSVWGAWPAPPEDAQRHALGAGFLTLLIIGMGLRLLPGFASGADPSRRHVGLHAARVSIGLAHTAALLRVVPSLTLWGLATGGLAVPAWLGLAAISAGSLAGLAGVAAVGAFAYALRAPLLHAP